MSERVQQTISLHYQKKIICITMTNSEFIFYYFMLRSFIYVDCYFFFLVHFVWLFFTSCVWYFSFCFAFDWWFLVCCQWLQPKNKLIMIKCRYILSGIFLFFICSQVIVINMEDLVRRINKKLAVFCSVGQNSACNGLKFDRNSCSKWPITALFY